MSGEEVMGLYSPISDHSFFSLTPTLTRAMTTPISTNKKRSFYKRFRNGQQVAVRPEDDGFFYPGIYPSHIIFKDQVVFEELEHVFQNAPQ